LNYAQAVLASYQPIDRRTCSVEDTDTTLEEIERHFGVEVRNVVAEVCILRSNIDTLTQQQLTLHT